MSKTITLISQEFTPSSLASAIANGKIDFYEFETSMEVKELKHVGWDIDMIPTDLHSKDVDIHIYGEKKMMVSCVYIHEGSQETYELNHNKSWVELGEEDGVAELFSYLIENDKIVK